MKHLQALMVIALMAGCGLIQVSQPDARDLVDRGTFDWHTDSTLHFVLYYEAESPAQQRLELIKQDAEASLGHILDLLHINAYNGPLHLFLVSSRTRIRELIGRETNGTAFYQTGVLVFIISETQMLSARHELLHVVAMNLWGVPEPWLNEGLAVYAGDHWHGYDLHALVHHLDETNRLFSLETLINRFRQQDEWVTYPVAGSFVKYLYEEYGVKAVQGIWKGGVSSVEVATGKTLSVLEAEWLSVVRATDATGIEYVTR